MKIIKFLILPINSELKTSSKEDFFLGLFNWLFAGVVFGVTVFIVKDKADWLTLSVLFLPFVLYMIYGIKILIKRDLLKSGIHMVGAFVVALFEYFLISGLMDADKDWTFMMVGFIFLFCLIIFNRNFLVGLK